MTLGAQTIDWTQVMLQSIATLGVIAVAFIAAWTNRRVRNISNQIQTPSGETIGSVAERTHDLAATNHAQLIQHGKANVERDQATVQTAAELAAATQQAAEQTSGQLVEIHALVNDRLDKALETIDAMRNELLAVKEARDALEDDAA